MIGEDGEVVVVVSVSGLELGRQFRRNLEVSKTGTAQQPMTTCNSAPAHPLPPILTATDTLSTGLLFRQLVSTH
jgi:hypothetical protein